MNVNAAADLYIPNWQNKTVLKYPKNVGVTRDIIKEVLETYKDCQDDLKKFAQFLKGESIEDTCRNIWQFWKSNIRYQVDPEGVQYIKTPAAVWKTKFCDCKSFSVAIASC